ncbi:hypothetical protein MRX96_029744 [Rhipicephalus microplus]
MASPMTPPRALDPFGHHNLSASFAFTSITQERGTPTLGTSTQRQPIAPAHYSCAGCTSKNPLICFQGGGRGHYNASSQADHAPATGETAKAGDGERIPIASLYSTAPP